METCTLIFTGELEYAGQSLKPAEIEVNSYPFPGLPSATISVEGEMPLRCFNSLRETMVTQSEASPVILRYADVELHGSARLRECSITVLGKNKFMSSMVLACEGILTQKTLAAIS